MFEAFGFDLEDHPDPDWTPVEAVVTMKCLDAGGEVVMFHSATPALNSYEALGMLRWTTLVLEQAMSGGEE